MVKKKKAPFLKRLFPTSPMLRIIFVVVTIITAFVVVQNVYHFVQVRQQEAELYQERDRLTKEKEEGPGGSGETGEKSPGRSGPGKTGRSSLCAIKKL